MLQLKSSGVVAQTTRGPESRRFALGPGFLLLGPPNPISHLSVQAVFRPKLGRTGAYTVRSIHACSRALQAFAEALKNNRSLTKLDLSENRFGVDGVQARHFRA